MPKRSKYTKKYMGRKNLACYGCSFSNDDSYPGKPGTKLGCFSPCHMCMRSPDVQSLIEVGEPLLYTQFPDGSEPVNGLPMDLYCTSDWLDQMNYWQERAVEIATQSQLRGEIVSIASEYGINMLEHEVDIPE